MLVNFKVKNFRSFYSEAVFSMEAGKNEEFKGLNTFEVEEKLLLKGQSELLKSAIIFGANASGKTNLLKALDYMKFVVLTSSSSGDNQTLAANTPFAFYDFAKDEPTLFEIELISNNIFYNYSFQILNGKVIFEELKKRDNIRLKGVFFRNENVAYLGAKEDFESQKTKQLAFNMKGINSLFISFGNSPLLINATISKAFTDMKNVLEWFKDDNLIIINDSMINRYSIYKIDNDKYAKKALDFLKNADFGVESFCAVQSKFSNEILQQRRQQIYKNEQANELIKLDLKTEFNVYNKEKEVSAKKEIYLDKDYGFHSDGTYRLLSILGLILKVLDNGGVLVIDEIDSKLNILIVDYILSAFNSIDRNKKDAQLVANAHNVLLMDGNMRRDQIYFASKNDFGETDIYSLSDFVNVRKNDLFSKKYLAGFYSAIPSLKGN